MPSPEYRIADETNLDDIIKLWNEINDYHENLDSRFSMVRNAASLVHDYYSERMKSDDTIFYIALIDNEVVGFVLAYTQQKPPVYKDRDMGFIDTFVVTEKYRRLGIGSDLVGLVKNWLLERGIHRLQLSVASSNSNGLAFWKSHGFTELSKRMDLAI